MRRFLCQEALCSETGSWWLPWGEHWPCWCTRSNLENRPWGFGASQKNQQQGLCMSLLLVIIIINFSKFLFCVGLGWNALIHHWYVLRAEDISAKPVMSAEELGAALQKKTEDMGAALQKKIDEIPWDQIADKAKSTGVSMKEAAIQMGVSAKEAAEDRAFRSWFWNLGKHELCSWFQLSCGAWHGELTSGVLVASW